MKIFGFHVCSKFTTWEKKSDLYSREPEVGVDSNYLTGEKVFFTLEWQERKCVECGLTQQKPLRN